MRWLWLLVLAGPLWAGEIEQKAIDRLPPADVYLLGETHGNAVHHMNQAHAVVALTPSAVVWEMLAPDRALRAVEGASMADLDKEIGWTGSGWPDFSLYYQIFMASASARHYGADVARPDLVRAMTGEVVIPGYGLDTPLDAEDQAAREAEQELVHCGALPAEMLPGMVAAQRLRDAALARAALQALEETGGPVVVITGTGHARRDTGVPAVMRAVAPGVRVLSVGQFADDPGPEAPFDLWIVTGAVETVDPCAAFR